MDDDVSQLNTNFKKPRKIIKVKPSKYEFVEALHRNKIYWNSVFREIDSSHKMALDESVQLANILPTDIYRKVCETLDIPIASSCHEADESIKVPLTRRMTKEPMLSYRKCILIDRDMDSDTDVEICSSDEEGVKLNIHQELLSKPEREQITWATHYLQPEREDEKTLVKKADDLTDRIAKDFCDYMKELGGDQQSQLFTPEAIKELFRIEFDNHAARGLRVISKELPSIQEKVAINTGNPEKSCYRALEREISKDIKAEHLPKRTTAFGQSLLLREQFYPPRNNTKNMWRSARHVPKELVTLKTVWEGITNLRI
ncbi:uncharacterized protein LOC119190196 [Manduca sexta]|uniref:uncharacterized protein LOC119190196 n=1 Tax=Manduca sexta TaxID=7130 RepID=UPI00188E6713|nr:uncharacterized protein LOC119190196 [Manduca sexta]